MSSAIASIRNFLSPSPATPPQIDKPVFVVGCGRSGTSMLFDLMAQHPGLEKTRGYPDGEDHEGWIKHGKCAMAGIGNAYSKKYASGINGYSYCLHMTDRDATPEVVQAMHAYYWRDVLKQSASRRVLNKQPHLSNKLGYVLEIFPDAKIVHIVRDCTSMVASWLAVMNEHPSLVVYWPEEELPCFWLMQKPTDPIALEALARHPRFYPGGGKQLWIEYWLKTNLGIEAQMAGRLRQLCTIRYEDLIQQPDRVLNAITKFCQLPDHDYQVEHIRRDTHEKHTKLLDEDLHGAIAAKAEKGLAHFGYRGPGAAPALLSFQ